MLAKAGVTMEVSCTIMKGRAGRGLDFAFVNEVVREAPLTCHLAALRQRPSVKFRRPQ
jgi:hypothetical protein